MTPSEPWKTVRKLTLLTAPETGLGVPGPDVSASHQGQVPPTCQGKRGPG